MRVFVGKTDEGRFVSLAKMMGGWIVHLYINKRERFFWWGFVREGFVKEGFLPAPT